MSRTTSAARLQSLATWCPPRPARWAILAANLLVILVAVAPFVLWETVGPQRFAGLDLGHVPTPPQDLASDADTAAAADPFAGIPLDLGDGVRITLVFSVGSRGLDDADAERLRVIDLDERGADGLADIIMLLVADQDTGQAALLSIPRDLWLPARGHRVNASFNRRGAQGLVDDVSAVTGLPIHHVVRLNFSAFAELVDAVGGVDIAVDRPLADVHSVLYVPSAGCWHLDGRAALAYVRSRRTLTRTDAGAWVSDGSASDFGRIERQQQVLGVVWDQLRGPGVVTRVPALLGAARRGLVVDDGLGLQEVRDLAAAFSDVAAGGVEGITLPTRFQRFGRAAAEALDIEAALPLLARLRQWPPDGPPDAGAAIPDAGGPLFALGAGLALPGGHCDGGQARALPDPFGPLGAIASGLDPAVPGQTASEAPSQAPSAPTSSTTPGGTSSPTPTPTSDPTTPSDPTPSPSDSDGGLLDLPPLRP